MSRLARRLDLQAHLALAVEAVAVLGVGGGQPHDARPSPRDLDVRLGRADPAVPLDRLEVSRRSVVVERGRASRCRLRCDPRGDLVLGEDDRVSVLLGVGPSLVLGLEPTLDRLAVGVALLQVPDRGHPLAVLRGAAEICLLDLANLAPAGGVVGLEGGVDVGVDVAPPHGSRTLPGRVAAHRALHGVGHELVPLPRLGGLTRGDHERLAINTSANLGPTELVDHGALVLPASAHDVVEDVPGVAEAGVARLGISNPPADLVVAVLAELLTDGGQRPRRSLVVDPVVGARGGPGLRAHLLVSDVGAEVCTIYFMPRRSPVFGTPEERLNSHLVRDHETGCLVFTGAKARGGYGKLTINGKTVMAHTLAWDLWVGPPRAINGKRALVMHATCDNPPCCEPSHLTLGTHASNSADMVTKGRSRPGEARWNARLTEADVRAIRKSSESSTSLSETYGVTSRTINKIRSRTRWGHVQ